METKKDEKLTTTNTDSPKIAHRDDEPPARPSNNPDAESELATLRRENDYLRARLLELEGAAGGVSGFLVTSPNSRYNGVTAGVQFRQGQAFIPDGPGATETVKTLTQDFDYGAAHLSDWREIPQAPDQAKSFIDVLLNAGPRS